MSLLMRFDEHSYMRTGTSLDSKTFNYYHAQPTQTQKRMKDDCEMSDAGLIIKH